MPSFDAAGEIYGQTVSLADSAARTANGTGPVLPSAEFSAARLTLNVTAASGTTPSATVTIQTSHDGSSWTNVAAFAAKTTTGTERKVFTGLDRYVRASWAITGTTPSFTFSVSGELV